jgi:N-carbamoyl-L-amino-acid hydrolase
MARICPAAMVFVPSRDGVSHRPDEYTAPHEIAAGAAVLAGALRRLSA